MPRAWIAALLLLAACQSAPPPALETVRPLVSIPPAAPSGDPSPVPSASPDELPDDGNIIDLEQIRLSPPSADGVIRVLGLARAVKTSQATHLRLALYHLVDLVSPPPRQRQLLHGGVLDDHYVPIITKEVPLTPEGGFAELTIGDYKNFAQHEDVLILTALKDGQQLGLRAGAVVP